MKRINKFFIFAISLILGLSACDEPNTEKPNTGVDEPKIEKKTPFEGYTFVLDQSQVPDNAGVESDKEAPPARLMAINEKGEFVRDVLADNKIEVNLGFDSKLQKNGDYFFIVSKAHSLKDPSKKMLATVLDAKTLKLVNQTKFDKLSGYYFVLGVNADKAFVGHNSGSTISILDLKTGELTKFASASYDSWASGEGGAVYKDNLFVPQAGKAAVAIYDINNPSKVEEISLPNRADGGFFKVSEDMLLCLSNYKTSCLVSMKTKEVVKTLNIGIDKGMLAWKSFVYDEKTERLYVAGKKKDNNRDKLFYFDLKDSSKTEAELFYTIPFGDIDSNDSFHGNIMIGINHDRDEMYIGHLARQSFVRNPNGEGLRAIRVGYMSKITELSTKTGAITTPDAKYKIEDLGYFSPFFSSSK